MTPPGRPIGLGILGLGGAAMQMLPSLLADERVAVTAVADVDAATRDRFARDFGVAAYGDVAALCADRRVDAVYVATPSALHATHAIAAAEAGKHVLVEKPLALTVAECLAVAEAAETNGVHVVVGHTHSFDPPVLAMWDQLREGRLGRVAMINTWNYGPFLYRPRRPDELDTARGGGAIFNQVPHQVDVVRLLGGGLVRSVRAAAWVLDAARPTEGSCSAFLSFEGGTAATLVYSGYDHFDSDELHGWVGELGEARPGGNHGAARRTLASVTSPEAEAELKRRRGYGGSNLMPPPERRHQPHFGLLVVSCERGDLRTTPDGYALYTETGATEVRLPADGPFPDRRAVLDELYRAAVLDDPPLHDAAWGTATVEVCHAILTSAREGREVSVHHQTPSFPRSPAGFV